MSEQIVARAISAHRSMLKVLDGKLEQPDAGEKRDELKTEIISFFKAIEQEIADLNALKDDVKKLVDKWKALQAGQTLAPEFSAPSTEPFSVPVREPAMATLPSAATARLSPLAWSEAPSVRV